jgi:hypothetical protein
MATETKVTAASGGAAVSAGGLGLLIAWIVDTYTAVDMPEPVAYVVGAIVLAALAGIGGWAAGWAKPSDTSAVSDEFNPAKARNLEAKRQDRANADRVINDLGVVDLRTVLIVLGIIALIVVIISFVDVNVRG